MDEQVFQLLVDKIDKLEEKVDKLLAFKWQIIGGSVVMSAIIGIAVQIILTMAAK